MDDLIIQATKRSPSVEFLSKGTLTIWGRLFLLAEPQVFMDKLHHWVDEYVLNPAPVTRMSIGIGHTGRKCWHRYMDIARKLSKIQDQEHNVLISWHFEDWDDDLKQYLEFELQKLDVQVLIIPVDNIE